MKKENVKCIASGGSQGCARDDLPSQSLKLSLSGKSLIHHWFSQNKLNIFFLSNELFCFFLHTDQTAEFSDFYFEKKYTIANLSFQFFKIIVKLGLSCKTLRLPITSTQINTFHWSTKFRMAAPEGGLFRSQLPSYWSVCCCHMLKHHCLKRGRNCVYTFLKVSNRLSLLLFWNLKKTDQTLCYKVDFASTLLIKYNGRSRISKGKAPTCYLANFSRKLHWNEVNWAETERVRP